FASQDHLVGTVTRLSILTQPRDTLAPFHTRSRRRRYSRNGRYGMCSRADHSGLMPANLITLAHFSVSFAMNFPKSAGVIGIGTPPRSMRRCLILGSARPALNSLLSVSTISAGVPLGAPTPYQVLAS